MVATFCFDSSKILKVSAVGAKTSPASFAVLHRKTGEPASPRVAAEAMASEASEEGWKRED